MYSKNKRLPQSCFLLLLLIAILINQNGLLFVGTKNNFQTFNYLSLAQISPQCILNYKNLLSNFCETVHYSM